MAAEIVIGAVGLAIQLGNCVVAPIKRQFNYLCCFNSNIQSLRDEAKKLEDARDGLQMQVDVDERNAKVIVPEVKTWLESANNEIQINMSGIEIEIQNVQSGCLAIKSRFSLSRKAIKMTEAMKEHRRLCQFDHVISLPAPPLSMLRFPSEPTHEFQSRKKIEEEIMEALRGKKVNMIGICGMGGVGKTTMAKRIMNRVREENVFDEVVMTVVSQKVDMSKIQQEIAESLGLKFEEGTSAARANKLRARLMGKNRVLIVLDDVWEKLKLEDLGRPCQSGSPGCTILLTSRNRDVLNQMDVQNVCGMEILSEPEAQRLFREKVGTWLDGSSVNMLSIAFQVAKECKGLPIALVTIGCALKDEKRENIWKNALDQLQNLNAIDMPDVIREVYNPLKLSYELLENQPAKSLFLLCCLFPEDSNISLDYLTMYSMGLGILGRITLGLARSRVLGLVEMLKSRSLLLDGCDEHHVRMHDVIRDVAIFIASGEGLVDAALNSMNWSRGHSHSDCKWISVFQEKNSELPSITGSNFGRHQLLMMHTSSYKVTIKTENFCFLEVMEELSVLSFIRVSSKSPPQKIQLRKNLRTLHLVNCSVETISIVGEELLGLEILCCRSCDNIKELPVEIGRLNRLKLLDFSFCKNLKTIAPGIISNLVELEELKMRNSFNSWESTDDEVKGKETRKNVSLKELESLLNLTHLEIDISDTLAAQEIHLSSIASIVKYRIQTSTATTPNDYEKCIGLDLPREITLGSWIHKFLSSTEALSLRGDGSNSFDPLQAHKYLKSLEFADCSTVKKLVNTTSSISIDWRTIGDVFPALEIMMLRDLKNLEEICDGSILDGSPNIFFRNLKELSLVRLTVLKRLWKNGPNQNLSFTNLSSIYISGCDKLCNLFSLAIAKDALLQLEKLEIWDCEKLEQVFSNEEEEKEGRDQSHHQVITFPKLKTLKLYHLRNLATFYKRSQSIEFPALTEMIMYNCPKLTSLVSSSSCTGGHADNNSNCHLFCVNQKVFHGVIFPMLETLELCELPNLEEICDSSILEGSNIFSKYPTILKLQNLPALKHLWKSSPNQNLVSLTNNLSSINIYRCDELHNLLSFEIAKDALLQLQVLRILYCEMMEEIFSIQENKKDRGDQSHRQIITFPKLKKLELINLKNLTTFCKGIESIEFPLLAEMKIDHCPQLTSLVSSSSSTEGHGHDDNSFHLFYNKRDSIGVFPALESLWLFDLPNLKEICDGSILEGSTNHFKNLNRLILRKLPALKHLWKNSLNQNLLFTNLSSIYISDCDKLSNLFSLANAKEALLQLEKLQIRGCKKLEQVFSNEEEEKEGRDQSHHQVITFPKLKRLELYNLHSLTTFYKRSQSIEFPALTQMIMYNCPKLTSLVSSSSSTVGHDDDNSNYHLFRVNQKVFHGVIFPMLETLELCELPNLEEICDGSILEGSNIFSKYPKKLELEKLPALKHLWKCSPNQNPISLTNNLSSIDIHKCDKLHNFLSLAVAEDALLQLENLRIRDCEMMEEIFSIQENKKDRGDQFHRQIITFPKLKVLELQKLKNLATFCKGIESIEFPMLAQMHILDCPKLTSLISSSSTEGHGHDDNSFHLFCNQRDSIGVIPPLESLKLSKLPNLEEIYDGSILESSPNSFKNLKQLMLKELPALKHLWKNNPNQNISFASLSYIYIYDCDKLRNLFSLAIAKVALLQLKTLRIEDCEMLEEIFLSEELENKDGDDQSHHQIITFSKLETLVLKKLESLTTLCKGLVESIEFPMLKEMEIQDCPKLTSFDSSLGNNHQNSKGGHSHDDNSVHFFCSQRVAFGSLKRLKIGYYDNNINNIWCHQIPLGFFNTLEVLLIFDCSGIRSLFSSSIVGEFINLKELSIENCWEMEKVIGDEEKVCEKSLFARLEWLTLRNLQKLRNFCEWSCNFELPSLRIVKIFDCPLMENFTMGSLSIPKFEWANINRSTFKNMRDLNGVIQLHFRTNKESTSSSTKGEEGKGEE